MPLGRLLNALITISKFKSVVFLYLKVLYYFPFLHKFNTKTFFCVPSDGARVALKIIKNIDRYREAAMSEVEVLDKLKSLDAEKR